MKIKRIVAGCCFGVTVVMLIAIWISKPGYVNLTIPSIFQSDVLATAQYAGHDLVGNLGGVPVTIPKQFAQYVEYDGDPGFNKGRKGPVPKRTLQSNLRSFAFDLQYTENVQTPASLTGKNIDSIRVGINTGEFYLGAASLDNMAVRKVGRPNHINSFANYEKLPNSEFGLEVYAPLGINELTGKPNRQHRNAEDVFIYRASNGSVVSLISCSNRAIESAPCTHSINLAPFMNANVDISYRRSLLPKWDSIEQLVRKKISDFAVNQ